MYSRSAWGGDIDPFILVRFNKVEEEGDHRASMLIFEWMDQDLVLFQSSPDTPKVCKLSILEIFKDYCGRRLGSRAAVDYAC